MRTTILAIARLKAGPEKDLIDDYKKRFDGSGAALGFGKLEFKELEVKKRVEGEERKRLEATLIMEAIPPGAFVVALDERGKTLSSAAFAKFLAEKRDTGVPDLVFVIGGADGLTDAVRQKAGKLVSFSPMTWPHMLVRVMLSEQLYRGVSILAGHPYHKA